MRSRPCALAGLVLLALAATCPAVTLPPGTAVGAYAVIDAPASNPFASATLLDTVTAPSISIYSTSNVTRAEFLKGTASLTSSVYRNAAGRLGFAYTITSQNFRDPSDPFDFSAMYISQLRLPGFENATLDVSASGLPGDSLFTVYRDPAGSPLTFNFTNSTHPVPFTPFWNYHAGEPALTFYVQTDATAYGPATATLPLALREQRSRIVFATSDYAAASFAPQGLQATPIPEPLTLVTLPMALAALAWRTRRRAV